MSAREERWVMVRLLRETRQKLKEWLNIQDSNFCRGIGQRLRGQEDGVVSLDAAIGELLRRDEAHRQRAKKGRKKLEVKISLPADKLEVKLQALMDKVLDVETVAATEKTPMSDEVHHMGLVEYMELKGLV